MHEPWQETRECGGQSRRLVRMFSFQGDTVLDPFCGTGTTMLAALKTGRSSIGVEIDRDYCQMALRRLERETRSLFSGVEVNFASAAELEPYPVQRPERIAVVSDAPRRKRTRRN